VSEDELKVALANIHSLQLDQVESSTAINGRLNTLDERQDRMEAHITMAFDSLKEDGLEIAAIKKGCEGHQAETRRVGKRVSTLVARVSGSETTGQIHIAQVKQTWRTIAVGGAIFMALTGLVLALLK